MLELLQGEEILWSGRPHWPALAVGLLRIRWIAFYFAAMLIWGANADRAGGASIGETLLRAVPLTVLGVGVLGACALLAWACARTTTYTITTLRCVMRFGLALQATLSIPLHRIATVSVSVGSGDIPLGLKPGVRVGLLKLWPHVRPWRFARPEPMLRGLVDAAGVGEIMSRAVAAVSPGQVQPLSASKRAKAPALSGPKASSSMSLPVAMSSMVSLPSDQRVR